MSASIRIGIGDYESTKQIIEEITNDESTSNFNSNFISQLGASFSQGCLFENLGAEIERVNKYYETAPRIINPEAVKRIDILKKSVEEAIDIIDDEDISIEESIKNLFGWTYSLSIYCSGIGFAGNVMSLFKIAILTCDSFDIACSNKEGEVNLLFSVDNVYNIIK